MYASEKVRALIFSVVSTIASNVNCRATRCGGQDMVEQHIPRRIAFSLCAAFAAGVLQLAGCDGTSNPMPAIGGGVDAEGRTQSSVSTNRSALRLLVANALANNILEFSTLDDGDTPPSRIIGGSRTCIQEPIGIASAPDGRIAVAGANAVVGVFARGANGNVAPIYEILCGNMTVPLGAVYDAHNNLYVTNERYRSAITEFVPTDEGCVTGNRVISGHETRLIDPRGIQVDINGQSSSPIAARMQSWSSDRRRLEIHRRQE